MNNLTVIKTKEGINVVDSREVAEMIDKDHKELLRSIRNYIGVLTSANLRSLDYFTPSEYVDAKKEVRPCYLITKIGCDMVANKMTGEKGIIFTAEYVKKFEEMEKHIYYSGMSKELQAILMIDKKQVELDNRLEKLENNMTIDYGQQETLNNLARRRVIEVVGGTDARAYSLIGKKVFMAIWREYKRILNVNSYRNTAVVDFQKAINFIKSWKPQQDLELMIIGANAQQQINV